MKYQAFGYTKNEIARQDIDRETFERIKKAKATCLFAMEIEEKFVLLFDNFAEFEVELLRLAEFSLLWQGQARDYADSMQQRLLLDRRLVNLLSSCRLYLDQTDHGLSYLFGNPSTQLTSIREFKNYLYESHWGYRFMEALRNHVQHSGLSTQGIIFNRFRSEGESPDYVEFTVYPQVSVNVLAEDSQLKKDIIRELREKDEQMDLRGPLREYMSCFVELHDRLREVIGQEVEGARSAYEADTKQYSTLDGRDVRYPSLQELSGVGNVTDEIPLATNILDYLDKLRKRNSVNKNIHHSAASNTDQKRKY